MKNTVIYNDRPATVWDEATPLGNGSIGAMVYGNVDQETIQFNHDTFWSGNVREYPVESKKDFLPEARRLLFEGKYHEAEKFMSDHLMAAHSMSYLTLGFMKLRFRERGGSFSGYKRCLSLDEALLNIDYKRVSYRDECDNPTFSREMFISKPDDVMVMKIKTDGKSRIKLTAELDSDVPRKIWEEDGVLYMSGKAPSYTHATWEITDFDVFDDRPSVAFKMGVRVEIDEGQLRFCDGKIIIDGAEEAVFYISIKTNFKSFDQNPCGEIECLDVLDNAVKLGYDALKRRHIDDYSALFNRSNISIDSGEKDALSINERLKLYKGGEADNGIYELLYNFGKYLTIAGSRAGSQPTTLFGIWSGLYQQSWYGGYTTNINVEMNYWGTEVCNLEECHEPFLKMVEEYSVAGAAAAQKHFGCRGFCVNHNSDIWRYSLPIQCAPDSGFWPMAGAWFCRDLWEHYEFTKDTEFLRDKAFPITKRAAEFLLDWLIEDKDGYWVTAPSSSPENHFYDDEGRKCGIGIASAMDMTIIKELFSHMLKMEKLLGLHDSVCDEIRAKLPKLYPFKTASDGTICEYHKEFKEFEPGHRHLSHLYGLYPAEIINEDTPELYKAARLSLEKRLKNGGGQTGWSGSWIVHLWARLKEGNKAEKMLNGLVNTCIYDNLFDVHPPFQIDGNYGIMSGIAEMLLQSHNGKITVLPALPESWNKGSFSGLCARGGYVISAEWDSGTIKCLKVTDREGNVIHMISDVPVGYSFEI